MHIVIKTWDTDKVLFDGEGESVKSVLEKYRNAIDWSRADLREINFQGADLSGINLSKANLYGADLSGTILYGANLREVNLREANLMQLQISNSQMKDILKGLGINIIIESSHL